MSDASAVLVCPKCQGVMRTYERNSVTIDQCQECRGVFLDRGELDRLIDAEEQRYSASAPPPPPPPPEPRYDARSYRRDHDDDDDWRSPKHGGKRRRGGLLGELFD